MDYKSQPSLLVSYKLFLFIFLFATPHGVWDLNSPTRDWTWAMAVNVWNPNYYTNFFGLLPLSPNQFSPSVMSDFLWPHRLQHARFPCPSLVPGACSNSCPSIQWCHPTSSSSVVSFSSCLQFSPASGSFPMSQQFASSGQCIRDSASVLPKSIQGWFPFRLTVLISLLSKDSKSLLQHHCLKASILQCSAFFIVQLSHLYMTTGKIIALTI